MINELDPNSRSSAALTLSFVALICALLTGKVEPLLLKLMMISLVLGLNFAASRVIVGDDRALLQTVYRPVNVACGLGATLLILQKNVPWQLVPVLACAAIAGSTLYGLKQVLVRRESLTLGHVGVLLLQGMLVTCIYAS